MSLQFILGNSGSGKTEYMYRRVVTEAAAHPLQNYLVIVPEQFTLQTQRTLVELSRNKAIMNIDVLSFKRLAYRVFDDLGIRSIEILEETGKNLVLRKLAQEQEEKLTVLRPNLNRMGYISEVKSLLSEFVQYNITPEQLRAKIKDGKLSPVLEAKLSDVLTMYEAFEEFMQGNFITAEEILNVLRDIAEESELLAKSVLVFDEFTGFTPIQNQLLYKIFPLVEKIYISLSIDAREDFYHSRGVHELFDMSKKTIQSLMNMADRLQIEVLTPVVLADSNRRRFANAPALFFMEQNLFRMKSQPYKNEVKEIEIWNAKSPRDELILVAREINRLVQQQGYRYKEIAVVSGAADTYGHYVEQIFKKYRIPFFLDATKEILFHPFIEFIRAALEVIHRDFSYESVFRFLRCGFSDLTEQEIDLLENYVLAVGIRGKSRWKKPWVRMPRNGGICHLDVLNQKRMEIYDLFEPVVKVFHKAGATVEDKLLALYQMIHSLRVEQKLSELEKKYEERGQEVKAREYGQIYQIVMELFDKYVQILGKEELDISQFIEILDAGLEAAEVATIPPGYDTVTIGDIERTRLNKIKILFFVGVNDGIIPKAAGQGGIISQYERELLKGLDMELAPGAREQVFIQKFYLYLNLTKPAHKLYISYSRLDGDGRAVRPSYLISVIQRIFPKLEVQEFEELAGQFDGSTEEAAFDYLVYGKKDAAWYALANWFLQGEDKEKQERVWELIHASLQHYSDDPISREVARALYGNQIDASVTRLERFARCAYSHFLQYGLKLRERETAGFMSVDIGNLYHEALSSYSKKLADSAADWFTVSDEEREQLCEQAMKEAVFAYPNLGDMMSAGDAHMLSRMNHIFKQTVWALTKQVRKGNFVPEQFEMSFSRENHLDELSFQLEGNRKLQLLGRIDRLDTCEEDGRIYIKVIDYKSGTSKFDLIQIYQGVQLQLVVYMNAALEQKRKEHPKKEIIPGGILYYHIDDPVIEIDGELDEEEIRQRIFELLRPDGLVNSEENIYRAMDQDFEKKSDVIPVSLKKDGSLSSLSHVASTEEFGIISRFVNAKIRQLGCEIYDGKVSISPLEEAGEDSCTYCPYAAVCGIGSKLPGLKKRTGQTISKDEIYEKMETMTALLQAEQGSKEQSGELEGEAHGTKLDRGAAEGH